MLIVHHLRRSQSERIVWLCEELGLDYTLKCYDRDPVTILAPPEYKALHPMGIAPVIQDGDLTRSTAPAASRSARRIRTMRGTSTGCTSRTASCSR